MMQVRVNVLMDGAELYDIVMAVACTIERKNMLVPVLSDRRCRFVLKFVMVCRILLVQSPSRGCYLHSHKHIWASFLEGRMTLTQTSC